MKKVVTFILCILFSSWLAAQNSEVVKWTFVAKKFGDKSYEVHLTPTIQNSWHIYSQTSPEGGALPTTFSFNKNPLVSVEGKPKELGKIVSKYEEEFEVTVRYFEGPVDFVQVVKLKAKAKTNLSGSIEFMSCKDGQCLPPQTVEFSVKLE